VAQIFSRVLETAIENKIKRENGEDIAIPFPFPRFSEIIPGIQKRKYYIVTANSKVGKSKITDFLFVYSPINYVLLNKTNIKLKIFYFTLEMSKEDKIKEAISNKLFVDYNLIKSPEDIDSIFKTRILDNLTLNNIQNLENYFNKYESIVTYIDNIRNPYGIYNYMRNYAEENGIFYDKFNKPINIENIRSDRENTAHLIDRYEPNDPNEYVIVVTDHVSLLTPEKSHSGDLHKCISDFSSNYCLALRDRFSYIVVNVQQQAAATESVENAKASMLQPSANGLGDNKLTGRDCNMMLGLFAPNRYRIRNYEGYDITKLLDNHRELSVILNRNGSTCSVQLGFNGASNYFEELEKPDKIDYDIIINKLRRNV
jgi:replicative DNA helicase